MEKVMTYCRTFLLNRCRTFLLCHCRNLLLCHCMKVLLKIYRHSADFESNIFVSALPLNGSILTVMCSQ